MPTDPFVNPDLDDRPRHHQNLPAGVALPPAPPWRPDRPGDLRAGQPTGHLLGSPGPNIGFAHTLVERVRAQLQTAPGEAVDDAVAVVAEVAMKRAATFGRAPVVADVELATLVLGYDGRADQQFVDSRVRLVHGAAHEYSHRRRLVDAVPPDLLRLSRAEIHGDLDAWRASLGADS